MGGGNESRMSTSKALIVEDTREIARILETLLSAEGYEVTVDSDGTLAADWVALNKPELIVLDLTLPKVDGMELCRQLRSMTDAYVRRIGRPRHNCTDEMLKRRRTRQPRPVQKFGLVGV